MLSFNGFILKKISAIVLFILLITLKEAKSQENILDSTFTFRAGSVKTGNALSIITRQTGYYFTYDSRLINAENRTGLTFTNTRLSIILDSILKNDSLVFSVIDKYIIISKAPPLPSPKVDSLPQSEVSYISGFIIDNET